MTYADPEVRENDNDLDGAKVRAGISLLFRR